MNRARHRPIPANPPRTSALCTVNSGPQSGASPYARAVTLPPATSNTAAPRTNSSGNHDPLVAVNHTCSNPDSPASTDARRRSSSSDTMSSNSSTGGSSSAVRSSSASASLSASAAVRICALDPKDAAETPFSLIDSSSRCGPTSEMPGTRLASPLRRQRRGEDRLRVLQRRLRRHQSLPLVAQLRLVRQLQRLRCLAAQPRVRPRRQHRQPLHRVLPRCDNHRPLVAKRVVPKRSARPVPRCLP